MGSFVSPLFVIHAVLSSNTLFIIQQVFYDAYIYWIIAEINLILYFILFYLSLWCADTSAFSLYIRIYIFNSCVEKKMKISVKDTYKKMNLLMAVIKAVIYPTDILSGFINKWLFWLYYLYIARKPPLNNIFTLKKE